MRSCASTPTLESRVRKSGRRPLVGYAPWDRDNVRLIVRRPVPNEREALRSPLIFWQFARSCDFSNRLGIPSGYELEEIREQFHKIFTYGELKLDPAWDPIRHDPRFDELLAQLAPHE